MEENKNNLIDDDIEILDFDDNIPSDNPKIPTNDDVEILDFDDENIEETPKEINNSYNDKPFINENLNDDITTKEEIEVNKKLNIKAVLAGILIFIILVGVIIFLPFLNDIVMKNTDVVNDNTENITPNNKSSNINIDVKKSLMKIKDYTNYKYQNINDIYSKDNKGDTLIIKSNYTYLFNETKFSVEINKKISDFDYNLKDYYEKLDNIYNLYISDITTNNISKRQTTSEEFYSIINMYPNTIEYLINNHKVIATKEVIVDGKNHVNVTLSTPKEILNFLSISTDRIQNKIDISKLSIDEITVELLFDENERIYEIDFTIEDKNACLEELDSEISSAVLKYVFKDLNKIENIELPKVQ